MPRILILYASVGLGHKRAAEALYSAFSYFGHTEVELADALDYANPYFRRPYVRLYSQLTEKYPAVWKFLYEQTDRDIGRVTAEVRALVEGLGVAGLGDHLRQYLPDVVICTHFLPLELAAAWKPRLGLPHLLYCVVTDYVAHAVWAYKNVDGYFAATEETRTQLVERGVASGLVRVSGIPVDPIISQPRQSLEARAARGLAPEQFVITLFGGGLNVHHVRVIVEGLLHSGICGTLVVVAGRNAKLLADLSGIGRLGELALHTVGLIDYVDDLLVASDAIITKAGGLMVSEALARGTPMIIIDPIPGQEAGNLNYLTRVGAAIGVCLPEDVPNAILELLNDSSRLQQMRRSAASVARPRAALDIVEEILQDARNLLR